MAGSAGSSGLVDGIGSVARFSYPASVAVDRDGNVLVADLYSNAIRKITPEAVVTTILGANGYGGHADGPLASALVYKPSGIAVDKVGNIYVADSNNYTVRKITPAGVVSTLAGQAGYYGSTDGTGAVARFSTLAGIAVDASGNVFVADSDNNVIREITPDGVVTTIAGSAGVYGSADGTGAAAHFDQPKGVAVDAFGTVYVADWGNHTIRRIATGGVVTTIAGTAGTSGNTDAVGTAALFNYPYGIAVDGYGGLYVTDEADSSYSGGGTIRYIAPDRTVTTIGGSATNYGSNDGVGSNALFRGPRSVALDAYGNLYVADTINDCVRFGYTADVGSLSPTAISHKVIKYQVASGAGSLPTGAAFTAVHGEQGTYAWLDGSGGVTSGQSGTYVYHQLSTTVGQVTYTSPTSSNSYVTTFAFTSATEGTWTSTYGRSAASGSFVLADPAYAYTLIIASGSGNWISKGTVHMYCTTGGSFTFLDANNSSAIGSGEWGSYTYASSSDSDATFSCTWGGSLSGTFTLDLSYSSAVQGSYVISDSNGFGTGTFLVPVSFAPPTLDNSLMVWSIDSGLGGGYLATNGGGTTAWRADGSWENLSQYGDVAYDNHGNYTYFQDSANSGMMDFLGGGFGYLEFLGPGIGYQFVTENGDVDWGPFELVEAGAPTGTVTQTAPVAAVAAGSYVTMTAQGVSATGKLNYQWALNGIDIAGATSSSYTIWSVAGTDAGVYTVRLSDGNGSTTLAAGTLQVSGFALSVDLVDPNPLLMNGVDLNTDTTTLSQGGTTCKGVVSDGVTLLLLRAHVPDGAKAVTFTIGSAGDQSSLVGQVGAVGAIGELSSYVTVTPVSTGQGTFAFAVYHAPTRFSDGSASYESMSTRYVNLNVSVDSANSTMVAIDIHRPPVLLIHGLDSSPSTWSKAAIMTDQQAGFYPLVYRANYFSTSEERLKANEPKVAGWVDRALATARDAGYAATQVDVVAHSMGGLLARLYVQDSRYARPANFAKGDFHSLTTFNTPHLGSPLADAAVIIRDDETVGPNFVRSMARLGHNVELGAYDDLRVGSSALRQIKRTPVPSVAFVGEPGGVFAQPVIIDVQYAVIRFYSGDEFLSELTALTTGGDGVVPISSQQGGIASYANHIFTDRLSSHITCAWDPDYYSDPNYGLYSFLSTSGSASDYIPDCFPSVASALDGSGLVQLVPQSKLRAAAASHPGRAILATGTLTLTSTEQVAEPGGSVTVNATYSGMDTVDRMMVVGPDTAVLMSNGSATIQIPSTWVGNFTVQVFAIFTDGSEAQSNTLTLKIQPAAALIQLTAQPSTVVLTASGQTEELALTATYADGTTIDLPDPTILHFSSDNTAVATVDANGVVAAVADGTCNISVSEGVTTATIPVTVNIEYEKQPTIAGQAAPQILSSPTGSVVDLGQPASFSVSAYGDSLTYQWLHDGVAVDGARQAAFSIPSVSADDFGSYVVIVANTAGVVTTTPVSLEQSVPPAISAQPTSVSVDAGGTATLSVAASGNPPPTYQWYFNGVAISGATDSTLTLSNVLKAQGGSYTVVITSGSAKLTSNAATLSVVSSQLVNISTRALGGTGNNVTIGGFVVSGTTPKHYLIRAVGPTLTTQGIGESEVMVDPMVELHDALHGNTIIGTDDNWGDATNADDIVSVGRQIGATAFAAGDTTSSALLLTLNPGIYTFVAQGKANTTGVVLIEVYDADTSDNGTSLVNISSRARASTGNGVAIGGFVVNGNVPKHLLVRAVGPTLTTQGIKDTEVLLDPTIEVHDALHGNAIIATNDNWGDNSNASDIVATGARIGATPFAVTDTTSSALLLTVQPGVYSFVANGKGGTSGIVLVEVYDAD